MSRSLYMTGNVDSARYVCQDVTVKTAASTRETFTLSGWAKGYGLPTHARDGVNTPQFRLRAVITFTNGTTQTETADFSPCTEEWQLASVQFAKNAYKGIKSIRVYCDYSYNSGTVRRYVPMEGSYYDPMLLKVLSKTNLTIGELVKKQLLPIGHEFDHLCHLYSEGVIDMDVANRVMDYKMEVTKCR